MLSSTTNDQLFDNRRLLFRNKRNFYYYEDLKVEYSKKYTYTLYFYDSKNKYLHIPTHDLDNNTIEPDMGYSYPVIVNAQLEDGFRNCIFEIDREEEKMISLMVQKST